MNKFKKSIIVLTVFALIAGCLQGCGSAPISPEGGQQGTQAEGQSGTQQAETPKPTETAGTETPKPTQTADTESPLSPVFRDNKAEVLGSAVLPEITAKYPSHDSENYWEEYDKWIESRTVETDDAYINAMKTFCDKLAPVMSDYAPGENVIYSPMNLWFALSLLAEVTDGDTKEQILSVLGTDADKLCDTVNDMWRKDYIDDGIVKSLLANSIWLRNDSAYVQDTVDRLAEKYYASSFSGEMGSNEYNNMLHKWLNENTGNLLQDAAEGVNFYKDTVLALASTIYFKAPWENEFIEYATEDKIFHGAAGDVTVPFMNKTEESGVYVGKDYVAFQKYFGANGGSMWFILPNEGVTPEEVVKSGNYEKLLFNNQKPEYKRGNVILSVPKFDVDFDGDVVEVFKKMGITNACEGGLADFSPIMGEGTNTYLDEAIHAARVKIDEEGVEAAAFTVMMMKNTAIFMGEDIEFTLDRPFLFVVTNSDNVPTFMGTVNVLK